MEFRLVYRGVLPSGQQAGRVEKQAIRRALHPQLRDLWARPPLQGRFVAAAPARELEHLSLPRHRVESWPIRQATQQ